MSLWKNPVNRASQNWKKSNEALKQEIAQLKTKTTPSNGSEAQKELEQQLNSERLKAGDLEAQLAALKTNVADIDNSGNYSLILKR